MQPSQQTRRRFVMVLSMYSTMIAVSIPDDDTVKQKEPEMRT